jgi:non-specific protein-tyrosine kinase
MKLRQYASIIWKWLWLIILGTLVAGVTAFVVSRRMTPVYEASATLLIQQADNPSLTYSDILGSERLARTYAELLTKQAILDTAAERLGLEEVDEDAVSVQSVRDTQLIELKAEHINPQLAAEIANTIPAVFIERNEAMQLNRFSESKESLARELSRLQADTEAAQARIDAIGVPATAAEEAELARLQMGLTQYRSSYATLLSSYEATRLAEARTMDNVVVVQEAGVPEEPVRPRTMLNTLLAAVVGAMLAVGTALLIEYLDDTLKCPEDVARVLGLSTLGAIAHMRMDGRANRTEEQLVTALTPKSPISEAFRTLRTNIQFSSVDKPIRRLLVTSPSPTDGKSITAANLATVMAQAGQSVVLVDGDLRRPVLHKIFKLPNAAGVTSAMLARSNPSADGCLLPTQVENLQLLTSGPLPPNPSELLGSQRMSKLIEDLEQEADMLIFDSPPTLVVTDAAVLAKQVDGVLLVIDARTTREEVARRAMEELAKVGAPVLGVVLNKVPVSRRGGYGYYYYHYYYYSDSEGGDKKARRRRHGSSGRLPSTLRGAVRRIAETLRLRRGV